MRLRSFAFAVAAAGALVLSGCATYDYDRPYVVYEAPAPVVRGPVYAERVEYGVVEHIDLYREGRSSPTGLGAIIGGIAGGIIGHQIGSGSGNTAATIGGAVAGGLVGNQIERANARDRYRITVRLDSGGTLTLSDVGSAGELRVGDRVRVVNGRVFRM
jgi:outer membrane lipoprotein SlyB